MDETPQTADIKDDLVSGKSIFESTADGLAVLSGSQDGATTEFVQWINTRKVYEIHCEHVDGSDLPVTSTPTWTMAHENEDASPALSGFSLATIETSQDGHTARITTGNMPGVITITVTGMVGATSAASKSFKIRVARHPQLEHTAPSFRISQHRNRHINH